MLPIEHAILIKVTFSGWDFLPFFRPSASSVHLLPPENISAFLPLGYMYAVGLCRVALPKSRVTAPLHRLDSVAFSGVLSKHSAR